MNCGSRNAVSKYWSVVCIVPVVIVSPGGVVAVTDIPEQIGTAGLVLC